MADGFDIKVDTSGVDKLFKELAQTSKKADKTTENFCRDVVNSAKLRAPFDTGKLKWSIRYIKDRKGKYTIEAGAPYAGFVEYGTRKMRAQPFMEPAFNANKNKYIAELKKDAKGK